MNPLRTVSTRNPASLHVEDLSVRFGGLQALQEVSFAVDRGEVIALIGPNGAGKSTCFNALSGFVAHTGRIYLDGTDISRVAPWRRAALGLVRTFQQPGIVRTAPVAANLLMAQHEQMGTGIWRGICGLAGADERRLRERAHAVLEALELSPHDAVPVGALSHGLQKTVELACALVRGPRLLVLDEPSAGLDITETASLADRLARLQHELGCTTVVIDHDLRFVRHLTDRVVVLSFGRLIADGTWAEIQADAGVQAAYLGEEHDTAGGTPDATSRVV